MKTRIFSLVFAAVAIVIAAVPVLRADDKPVIEARDYSGIKGMEGFSDAAMENHFLLYRGYVKNTNMLVRKLEELSADIKSDAASYAELKRRLGWEWNGALLHEYYFDNLGGNGQPDPEGSLYKNIVAQFGSFDKWKDDFTATGMMRGIGWAVLSYDPRTGRLVNAWIDEHNAGHIVASAPLLVMDVFEHAYMPDHQLGRAKYIGVFLKNVDWKKAEARFTNQRKQ